MQKDQNTLREFTDVTLGAFPGFGQDRLPARLQAKKEEDERKGEDLYLACFQPAEGRRKEESRSTVEKKGEGGHVQMVCTWEVGGLDIK